MVSKNFEEAARHVQEVNESSERVVKVTRKKYKTSDGNTYVSKSAADTHEFHLRYSETQVNIRTSGTLRQILADIHAVANVYGYDSILNMDAGHNNIEFLLEHEKTQK